MNTPQQPASRKTLTGKEEISHLAQMSGVTTKFMRKFVRETIAVIETGLLRDGVVKIHNFGTFRLLSPATAPNSSSTPQVVFQPAKNIRELVIRAFGPTVQTGSRVSLPALLEKHIGFVPPPSAPVIEEPIREEFDIAEVFPEVISPPEPRFAFAEATDKNEIINEDFAKAESLPIPANEAPPTFTLAETVEESEPAFFQADTVLDQLLTTPMPLRRRSRRFVWYAGPFAIFLLLLLFLLPGRISEQQQSISHSVVSTAPTENSSARNGSDPATHGQSKVAPVSTSPAPFFAGGAHRVAPKDNLWGVSGQYYRDPYLWPNIYRANTATIRNPDVLEIDQQLALPVLYGPPTQLTIEDRHNLAEGYFLLYRYYKSADPALAPFALWAAVRYEARIKNDYAAELREDDLAFLEAHTMLHQVVER